jgi:pimeloyl-ACP methyl ester carboxylesterase
VFDAEHPVRHLFVEGRRGVQELIVVFSGFQLGKQWKYNYVRTLSGTPAHRVHILDDLGERGCYYLGAGKDLLVERSIVRMLDALLDELGLDRSQAVLTGSSKGGTAALYYGVRHGYGRVLAAAPQTRIATYCVDEARAGSVAKLIAGSLSPEDMAWLDDLVFQAVRRSPHRPDVEIFISDVDAQLETHVMPMVELLEELGYPLRITRGRYGAHADVGKAFPTLLRKRFMPARDRFRLRRAL